MRITTYTLFRRGSVYYAKKVYQGKVYTVTTGSKQLTQAQLLAPKLLTERIKGSERQLTVSQLLEMHLKYAVHLRPKTLKMIGQFTRMYLNELGVMCPDPEERSAPIQLVISLFKDRELRGLHIKLITANTTLRMALLELFSLPIPMPTWPFGSCSLRLAVQVGLGD